MISPIKSSDAAFNMMKTTNSMMDSIRNADAKSDINELFKKDKNNMLQLEKERLNYAVSKKLEQQQDKLKKEKIKRSFNYFA